MDISEAKERLLETLEPGSWITSAIEHEGMFLFMALRPVPMEIGLDPFFSVNPATYEVRDFSPQDYPSPISVITKLQAALEEGGPT